DVSKTTPDRECRSGLVPIPTDPIVGSQSVKVVPDRRPLCLNITVQPAASHKLVDGSGACQDLGCVVNGRTTAVEIVPQTICRFFEARDVRVDVVLGVGVIDVAAVE